jgi:hypothetical protein
LDWPVAVLLFSLNVSGGSTREAAEAASSVILLAFIPLAFAGLGASARLAKPAPVKS